MSWLVCTTLVFGWDCSFELYQNKLTQSGHCIYLE